MKYAIQLNQFADKLTDCIKLEASIFNALKAFSVCCSRLIIRLSRLAKNQAITTLFPKPKFALHLPHINVCVTPSGEFAAHMCRGLEGCTALTQQEAL